MRLPDLPIKSVLPDVANALFHNHEVVLQAPPGTGKTLLTAPSLLSAPWLDGKKIILLEPRRLAARMAASMMARFLNERVGETVGYQVRLDRCIGQTTRIEILTEGLLIQRLLHDQELSDVGLIIFDEFHERSIHADFGLAATLDMRSVLRPDLRLIVMSATIDANAIANHLGSGARIISASAPLYPIKTIYLERSPGLTPVHEVAAGGTLRALRETEGGILVFLPGEAEIKRTNEALCRMQLPPNVRIHNLYGALSKREQDEAVSPAADGIRKIVLATSIAESSLTIQDIRVVVDTGLGRVSRFSPRTGMSRLETIRVPRDRADQRRGRAGRMAPGVCYRLWDTQTDTTLLPETMPEILDADLAQTRLISALFGAAERDGLPWLTLPPELNWQLAGDLLYSLGATDANGTITRVGKKLASVTAHPRLAHMTEKAKEKGALQKAALLAAIVTEAGSETRLRGSDDLDRLVSRLQGDAAIYGDAALPSDFKVRVRKLTEAFSRGAKNVDHGDISAGRLLSWAYPDRIAQKRDNNGSFRMTGGHGVRLTEGSALIGEEMIVIAEVQDSGAEGLARLAARIDKEDIEEDFADQIKEETIVKWDKKLDRAVAEKYRRLGALLLSVSPVASPPENLFRNALLEGIRQHGVENLGWTPESRNLQARLAFLNRVIPEMNFPDLSDEAIAADLEKFTDGWLDGISKWEEIKKLDLIPLISAYAGNRTRETDRLAPTTWMLPCGHRAKIYYDQGETPVMQAKLQDFLGLKQTPALAGGKAPVKIIMLSPAQRPIAVTTDLATFWKTGYPLVRKDMRGRYPKHNWPENP